MIDICDFAVGLSRQLYGLTIASRAPRPPHDGDSGIRSAWSASSSAFNFPVAVWSWNAMLALVCGDTVVWKPSEKTPLTAIARARPARARRAAVCSDEGNARAGGSVALLIGGRDVGEALVDDTRVPLRQATGSTRMGRRSRAAVAPDASAATILELGGNNGNDRCALGRSRPRAARHRSSRPSAPPASAARRCAACSSTSGIYDRLGPRAEQVYATAEDRQTRSKQARWSVR